MNKAGLKEGEKLNIVVTGAGGQLGHDVIQCFQREKGVSITGFTRLEWDVTDSIHTTRMLDQFRPDVVIHCASFTRVDESESNPGLAYQVNVDASRQLAQECGRRNIRLVYISTDYVFDGKNQEGYTEYDFPNPINQYGRTKRLGETWVQKYCPHHLILRTSWLYGAHGHNFVQTILRKAKQKETLSVVTDQVGSPTYTGHLAKQMKVLLQTDAKGIFHTANTGSCSWYQFAKTILDFARINVPIQAILSSQLNRKARRPASSILLSARMMAEGYQLMPHWKEGLREFFAQGREGKKA
ncbi:dTDP-4-dehydrorhamnose reductase [Paenactinomyces guangxiensis]|uniref:dTDP-4-dehydrorhamnose reductase n=1 Tax=Paenactinomyces guangxiensis TaxID=1490290 RepID=A0A7W1WQZ9_9BACL|nr:dTDP-4-dehydrorhamnose reductase [Paenactinomyces guangxiensis]MBA4494469.1 dTDP-4-dehydrorhamnose reductase [Paenactinomyces guangxiensis]MBH8591476.1 dTDP-4-dehydrorhamnose reductase [Paenactinomyces guangxiensis]